MKPHRPSDGGLHWPDVPHEAYKTHGEGHRGVSRRVLFGPDAGLVSELRYFEVAPGGHTTLEKHAHVHAVVVVRGRGRVLVGDEVFAVRPFDLVHVPPRTLHQLRADADEALGFLCLVDRERDRGVKADAREREALRARPESAPFAED